jgi:hypothetical protein
LVYCFAVADAGQTTKLHGANAKNIKNMKTLYISAVFVLSVLTLFGQITFQKTYGGSSYDFGLSARQTPDGGYILFGQTQSFGNGAQDMYLIKTDELGNELWSQTYGGTDWEFGISAQPTNDGGYILCGGYSGLVTDSLALIKTDSNGNVVWNKRYSGTLDRDVGQFVQQTSDGGFIAVGFTGPSFAENIYMVKTDENGTEQWSKVFESTGREFAVGVKQTSDDGYVIIGETNSTGFGGKDMYLVKTNSVGDTIWTKTFGTASNEIGRAIDITSDNGFIILGYEDFNGGNLYLVKTDDLGNELWSNYYGETGWDMGHSVQQTTDGGYILAGRKESTTNGSNHMYCIKTDNVGGVDWSHTYPRGIMSDAYSVQQTFDGGYILFGSTADTVGGPHTDMYLVKIDGLGLVSIYDYDLPKLNVSVYPNPFSDYTTIELNDSKNREFSMTLVNSQGQVIKSINNINAGQVRIERGNLAGGLYFFQLSTNKQVVAVGKLIIK